MKVEIDIQAVCTCGQDLIVVREMCLGAVAEITVTPCPNPECRRRQEENKKPLHVCQCEHGDFDLSKYCRICGGSSRR